MSEILETIREWFNAPLSNSIMRSAIILCIALPVLFIISRFLRRVTAQRISPQTGMVISKIILYSGFLLILISILNQFGFELGALLGAAGIAAVAIGFAAQTSLSNIISGIFLISEKPFAVGDMIRVGDDFGFVLSIDLLSVKIRALDNRYIRIPNEDLIKSRLINLTRYQIRRIDINVGVAYKEDPDYIIEVLKDIAKKNPLCLDEPEALIVFSSFGESSLDFVFGVWCVRTDYLKLKNSIMSNIKKRFDEEGIEIPFPHRTIYTGSETAPMPVSIQHSDAEVADS